MNKKPAPLVDEHLQSLSGMKEAETDEFFYTRLKAKMLNRQEKGIKTTKEQNWIFRLKPVWVIGGLVLLLAMNGFMLLEQSRKKETGKTSSSTPLQSFAESFDQSITYSY